MIYFQEIYSLQTFLDQGRQSNKRIGFVPTMGALHQGHISLIHQARTENDIVVCSIFVNPTQFNALDDLQAYPRTIENDLRLLIQEGCDVVFHPQVQTIYPNGFHKESAADFGPFINVLEGQHRPGHFDGVVTVVKRLFQIIQPNHTYFGQKDYQQCLVVQELIKRESFNIQFHMCEIIRESDGLAMSSRNIRLSEAQRRIASRVSKALFWLKDNWPFLDGHAAKAKAIAIISHPEIEIEYLELVDSQTLEPIRNFTSPVLAVVAVRLGEIRLIDNILLNENQ